MLLDGGDFYDLPGPLQFLYPPFAALLAVPLALLPLTAGPDRLDRGRGAGDRGDAAPLRADRLGAQPGRPAVVSSSSSRSTQTLAFGQLGIFLVALVVLDLAPGPRVLPGRRLLPEGC